MKITDKMRLDWLSKSAAKMGLGYSGHGRAVVYKTAQSIQVYRPRIEDGIGGKTLRQAIDAAIRASSPRAGKKR